MEKFTAVFRQRSTGLRCTNETQAGTSKTKKVKFIDPKSNRNISYFAELRPKIDDEFLEFNDRYEINLNCSSIFEKNDITIRFNEADNQIRIIAFQSKNFADKLIVNRKILRCFRLPSDIYGDKITSVFMKHSNQLKIRLPKFKRIIDCGNSDGESFWDDCEECEEV